MIAQVKKPPSVMAEPEIMETDVIKCIKKMKNKTAAGPDELKPELYKALLGNKKMLGGHNCMLSRGAEQEQQAS